MLGKLIRRQGAAMLGGSDPKGPLAPGEALPTVAYDVQVSDVPAACFRSGREVEWYPAPILGAETLGREVLGGDRKYVDAAADLLARLTPDDYTLFLLELYSEGRRRAGTGWAYADIVTVLLALATRLSPRRYLEIGVRRGRSACAVASRAPDCEMVLCDMWVPNYAGMDNPGPDLVRSELARVGHRGPCTFLDGDSHVNLPRYFGEHPDAVFDLITVDGDHTKQGAAQDLRDVLPHLAVGGAVVFDDIAHPKLAGLRDVWSRMVVDDPRFSTWSYADVGYGVGFAVRKW